MAHRAIFTYENCEYELVLHDNEELLTTVSDANYSVEADTGQSNPYRTTLELWRINSNTDCRLVDNRGSGVPEWRCDG